MFLKLCFGLKSALLISNFHTLSSHVNACGENNKLNNLKIYVLGNSYTLWYLFVA